VSAFWLKYRGTRFPIRRGETVVGRSPYCSIVLSNAQSSRQHCAIRLEGEVLSITDLNSANGTWVNDVRVSETRNLEAGDVIRIGTDVIEVLPTQDANGEHGRPITHQRGVLDTEKGAMNAATFEEAPQTQTADSQLELVEALVASASEARRPLVLAPMIQRTIDSLIEKHTGGGRRLSSADVTRTAAVIEIVAGWSPSQLGAWREQVLERLSASPSKFPQQHPTADARDQ
jgi:pSer/pThr/pTyr-binding forkhead associated (FHA) protein